MNLPREKTLADDLPQRVKTPFGDGAVAHNEGAVALVFTAPDHIEAMMFVLCATDELKQQFAEHLRSHLETGRD